MRYFAELAYNGTPFSGWQKQPNSRSIQEAIEEAFSTILNMPIEVVGCGRTDAGVHARQYFLHFDYEAKFPKAFVRRVNKFLPKEIAIFDIFEVPPDAHARFGATHRAYEYHLHFVKDPFHLQTSYYHPFPTLPKVKKMQQAAWLLLEYEEFFPFCKSRTEVKTMRCALRRAEWKGSPEEGRMVFHIASNRFLRGMVRLIVGMCLNVGTGKLAIEDLRQAMDGQERLKKNWSAPPEGLFLKDIRYPFLSRDVQVSRRPDVP